jgi:RES domain-containing protein
MIVARIAPAKYADLKGIGAQLYGGRWSSPGRPVVYTASCGALAALEYRAHVTGKLPPLKFLRIEVPDLAMEEVDMIPGDVKLFRQLGDEWLERGEKPLLRVPSVLVPYQWNLLINPGHKHADSIRIVRETSFGFDSRLVATVGWA